MPAHAVRIGGRMPPVIDEEELERIRSPEKHRKRNWYTSSERIQRVDEAVEEFGFRSSNKFLDRAADFYMEALREAKDSKRKIGKK